MCKVKNQNALRTLFHPNKYPKALELNLGRVRDGTISEARGSDAALRIIAAGRLDTWTEAPLVRSSAVALLLLQVLAQQRPHLLLVVKGTGTETGAQPISVLGRQSEKSR